jgi:hypothetical protein
MNLYVDVDVDFDTVIDANCALPTPRKIVRMGHAFVLLLSTSTE